MYDLASDAAVAMFRIAAGAASGLADGAWKLMGYGGPSTHIAFPGIGMWVKPLFLGREGERGRLTYIMNTFCSLDFSVGDLFFTWSVVSSVLL